MMERMGFPISDILCGSLVCMSWDGFECWRYICAKRHKKTPQSLVLSCVNGWRVVHWSFLEYSGVAWKMCRIWVGKVVWCLSVSMYVHVALEPLCSLVCMISVQ